MKVLLFTHGQDIDGIGSILLGSLAFSNFDFIPCKTFEITTKVSEKIKDKTIYNYDAIFVTDLCIKEPLLSQIAIDKILKDKLLVLDHHKTEQEEGNDKYPFVHIIVENEFGKTSGTSLFYNYLLENNFLKRTPVLDEFVERTRQYDTWEWKTKYHNPKARTLHILLEELGYQKYLEIMFPIIKNSSEIKFPEPIEKIISDFDQELNSKTETILKKLVPHTEEIDGISYRIGFITIPYKYRNEFEAIIKQKNIHNIDAVGMIMTDTDTVSYRRIKSIDVSKIGVYFGGKGHEGAATHSQKNPKFIKVFKNLNIE